LQWEGLENYDDNGVRKKLPNDLKRLDEMRDLEIERKKDLKKDIEHFGDPFQTYGFGLVAYRMTISRLASVFIFFTIISLPIILTY
jgi:hypothetical protein